MKRIIAAVDGSEQAERALQKAAQLAKVFNARLTIAYVAPLFDEQTDVGIQFAEFEQAHEAYALKLLEHARGSIDLAPDKVESALLRGTPAEAVAHAAQASDVEMVVVGSRGRGAVSRVLLGSVSDRLVHICSKPVLVVH